MQSLKMIDRTTVFFHEKLENETLVLFWVPMDPIGAVGTMKNKKEIENISSTTHLFFQSFSHFTLEWIRRYISVALVSRLAIIRARITGQSGSMNDVRCLKF